jgi:hypothetical protein
MFLQYRVIYRSFCLARPQVHEKRLEVDKTNGGRREEERTLMENIPTMFANFPAKKLEKPKKSVANRNAVTCNVILY